MLTAKYHLLSRIHPLRLRGGPRYLNFYNIRIFTNKPFDREQQNFGR